MPSTSTTHTGRGTASASASASAAAISLPPPPPPSSSSLPNHQQEDEWNRLTSRLDSEVNRIHGTLESAQRALEIQAGRVQALEAQHLQAQHHRPPTTGAIPPIQHQEAMSSTSSLGSPSPMRQHYHHHHPQQQAQQQHVTFVELPRPHSRVPSPAIPMLDGHLRYPHPPQQQQPAPMPSQPSAAKQYSTRSVAMDAHAAHNRQARNNLIALAGGRVEQQIQQQHGLTSPDPLQEQLTRHRQRELALETEVESLRNKVGWQEKERVRLESQVVRLNTELEHIKVHASQLRKTMAVQDRLKAEEASRAEIAAQSKEEERERLMEERASLQKLAEELKKRVDALEAEGASLRDHNSKLDAYMLKLAAQLDEARISRVKVDRQMEQHQIELSAYAEGREAVIHDLKALAKAMQRTSMIRKTFDRVLNNLAAAVEHFRQHDASADLSRRMVVAAASFVAGSTTASTSDLSSSSQVQERLSASGGGAHQNGGKGGRGGGMMDDFADEVKKLLADVTILCPTLLDEIGAGRQESELLGNELSELVNRLNKIVQRASRPLLVADGGKQEGGKDLRCISTEEKVQRLDDAATQIATMLRSAIRLRSSHVQGMRGEAMELKEKLEVLKIEADAAKQARERMEKETRSVKVLAEQQISSMRKELDEESQGRVVAEKRSTEQMEELTEKRRRVEKNEQELVQLRQEREKLRHSLSEGMVSQAQAEGEAKAQVEAVAALSADLQASKEECTAVLHRIQQVEAMLDTAKRREADALERLEGTERELRVVAQKLGAERARRDRLVCWTVGYLEMMQSRHRAALIVQAWRREAANGAVKRWKLAMHFKVYAKIKMVEGEREMVVKERDVLREQLNEAETRVTAALEGREVAAAIGYREARRHVALGEALAEERVKQRMACLVRRVVGAWTKVAREKKQSRQVLYSCLKRHVLNKRVKVAEEAVTQAQARSREVYQSLQEAREEKEKACRKLESEILTSRAHEMTAHSEIERLARLLQEMENTWVPPNRWKEMERQTEMFKAESERFQESLERLEGQLGRGANEVKDLDHRLMEKEQEVARLRQEVSMSDRGRAKVEAELSQLRRELQAEVELALKEGGTGTRTEGALALRLRRVEGEKVELMQQLADAKEEVKRLSLEVEGVMIGMKEDGVHEDNALMQQLIDSRQAVAVLADQLDQARRDTAVLEEQIDEARDEIHAVEEQVKQVKEEAAGLQDDLRQAEESKADLEARMHSLEAVQRLHHEEASTLKEQIEKLTIDLETKNRTLVQLQQTVELQHEELNRLMRSQAAQEERVKESNARTEAFEAERSDLQAKLNNKEALVRELTDQLVALQHQHAEGHSVPQLPLAPADPSASLQAAPLPLGDLAADYQEAFSSPPARRQGERPPSPTMVAELAGLQKALEKAEEEKRGLVGRLEEICRERDELLGKAEEEKRGLVGRLDEICRERAELLELCDVLRDEIEAVVDETHPASPSPHRRRRSGVNETHPASPCLHRRRLREGGERGEGERPAAAPPAAEDDDVIDRMAPPESVLHEASSWRGRSRSCSPVARSSRSSSPSPRCGATAGGDNDGFPSISSPERKQKELERMEREVEKYRRQLEREAYMRKTLQEESKRVRKEKEEHASAIAHELDVATRQRDLAAKTAHNLQLQLQRSQNRVDHLIIENINIRDTLTNLGTQLDRVQDPSSTTSTVNPSDHPSSHYHHHQPHRDAFSHHNHSQQQQNQHSQQQQQQQQQNQVHLHDAFLYHSASAALSNRGGGPVAAATAAGGMVGQYPVNHGCGSSEPEWSPSSNAMGRDSSFVGSFSSAASAPAVSACAVGGGQAEEQEAREHHDWQGGGKGGAAIDFNDQQERHRSSSGKSRSKRHRRYQPSPEEELDDELGGGGNDDIVEEVRDSIGGKAFLVSSRSGAEGEGRAGGQFTYSPHSSTNSMSIIGVDNGNGGRKYEGSWHGEGADLTTGHGARQEILRLLHVAEQDVAEALQRKVPVNEGLVEYIEELKGALKRCDYEEGGGGGGGAEVLVAVETAADLLIAQAPPSVCSN